LPSPLSSSFVPSSFVLLFTSFVLSSFVLIYCNRAKNVGVQGKDWCALSCFTCLVVLRAQRVVFCLLCLSGLTCGRGWSSWPIIANSGFRCFSSRDK
jgi:hypothetical protein